MTPGHFFLPACVPGFTPAAGLVLGRLFLIPFLIGRACHLATVGGPDVTVIGDVGGVARHGVFTMMANGLPGSIVQDFGTVPTDAVAIPQLAVSQFLPAAWYYQGVALQLQPTTRATVQCFNTGATVSAQVGPTTPNFSGNGIYIQDGVAGAFPATITAPVAAAMTQGPAIYWAADS